MTRSCDVALLEKENKTKQNNTVLPRIIKVFKMTLLKVTQMLPKYNDSVFLQCRREDIGKVI